MISWTESRDIRSAGNMKLEIGENSKGAGEPGSLARLADQYVIETLGQSWLD